MIILAKSEKYGLWDHEKKFTCKISWTLGKQMFIRKKTNKAPPEKLESFLAKFRILWDNKHFMYSDLIHWMY